MSNRQLQHHYGDRDDEGDALEVLRRLLGKELYDDLQEIYIEGDDADPRLRPLPQPIRPAQVEVEIRSRWLHITVRASERVALLFILALVFASSGRLTEFIEWLVHIVR